MKDQNVETMWLPCAKLTPNDEVPQPVSEWFEALEDGWKPSGPSMTVQTQELIVVFAMVQRPVSRIIVPDLKLIRELQ